MSHPRVGIDFSTLICHNIPDGNSAEIKLELEKRLLIDQTRLEMLKKLVGSDMYTRFKIEKIKAVFPGLENNILGVPLGWEPGYRLLVEITQFRKGKGIGPNTASRRAKYLEAGLKVGTMVSPVDCFLVHFYARPLATRWNGTEAFMNEVGDVMATVDGSGALTSFQVLIKRQEDGILKFPEKGRSSLKFVEGEDFVELLKPSVPDATGKVRETCDEVLRTLLQLGRLQPLHGRQ